MGFDGWILETPSVKISSLIIWKNNDDKCHTNLNMNYAKLSFHSFVNDVEVLINMYRYSIMRENNYETHPGSDAYLKSALLKPVMNSMVHT